MKNILFVLAFALPLMMVAQEDVTRDQIKNGFENLDIKPWQMEEQLVIIRYETTDGNSIGSYGTVGGHENESFLLQSFIEKNGYAQFHKNDSINFDNTDDAMAIEFLTKYYTKNTLFIYRVYENNTLIIAGTLK